MENMPDIQHMTDIQLMPSSQQNSSPFPVNDTKIPAKENIPASDHKRSSLPDNDTNMPADEQIPDKNHKR